MRRSSVFDGSRLPGLETSTRSVKTSTVGLMPDTVKSWWMRALATISRTAMEG